MAGLKDISFHESLDPVPPAIAGSRGTQSGPAPNSAEDVARLYLEALVVDKVPSVRGPMGDSLSQEAGFRHRLTTRAPEGDPRGLCQIVSFEQTHRNVPIFGARPSVELDAATVPKSVSGRASDRPNVSDQPTISKAAAIAVAARGGTPGTSDPELAFYFARDSAWHLAYHVRGVHVPSANVAGGIGAHGPGGSPRADAQLRDVLVDANDGSILLDYSATPLVAPIEITQVGGLDEEGVRRTFYAKPMPEGDFLLRDGLNSAATFDAGGKDIQLPPPANPVRHAGGDWKDEQRAAISAHHNAVVVLDYFRSRLKRNGLDGKNSELTSIVHSTYAKHELPPLWRNAVWWQNAMWYGQERDPNDNRLVSFATRLEIAAHEMTHGLVQYTAGLIYFGEHGALNESFSDIFGIIISNSTRVTPNSTNGWSWIIGKGLGVGGDDIRDMEKPGRLGYPETYDNYDPTSTDSGGVHINSNIHNKAAYNLLTAADATGPVFRPDEVALLYYLALLRLGPTSSFLDALKALLHAAATLYQAQGGQRQLDAIRKAYGDVAIAE